MHRYERHSLLVDTWFVEASRGLSREQLIDLLRLAIGVLWAAARTSVNDVTLDAVLERVVINAREIFPWLPVLPVVSNSIDVSILRAQCEQFKPAEVKKAVRFIVLEFLTINGNLTAEALSPALHRVLAKVRWKRNLQDSKDNGESAK